MVRVFGPAKRYLQNEWNALKALDKEWPSARASGRHSSAELSCSLRASVPGGNLTSSQLRQVAALVARYKLNLRTTAEQELLLHDIHPAQLAEIKIALRKAGLIAQGAAIRLTACPGSNDCSNAFTSSRALAQQISEKLLELGGANGGDALRIRVSGCRNGCALHVIGDIGLEGLAQHRDGTLSTAYRLWLGGHNHQQHPRLATDLGIVPADESLIA